MFCYKILAEKCFSLYGFGVGKMKFHHSCPPEKTPFGHTGKIHYWSPLTKILLMPMARWKAIFVRVQRSFARVLPLCPSLFLNYCTSFTQPSPEF